MSYILNHSRDLTVNGYASNVVNEILSNDDCCATMKQIRFYNSLVKQCKELGIDYFCPIDYFKNDFISCGFKDKDEFFEALNITYDGESDIDMYQNVLAMVGKIESYEKESFSKAIDKNISRLANAGVEKYKNKTNKKPSNQITKESYANWRNSDDARARQIRSKEFFANRYRGKEQ